MLFLKEGVAAKSLALALFCLAATTDYLDGYLARKYKLVSNFGKIMDPIADKFLTLSIFFVLAKMGIIWSWMVWVIAVREIGITVWRLLAMYRGKVLAAEKLGKWKTVSQMFAIFFILIYLIFMETAYAQTWGPNDWPWWYHSIDVVMWVAVILTVVSGISVLINNRKMHS